MNIRRFAIGDEAALYEVFFSAIHKIAIRDYTQNQVDAWAPAIVDMEKWGKRMRAIQPFVVELERGGEVVGYADVQATGYIDHFFVSGRYPRCGIGRLLMVQIHQEARRLELTELTSDVSRTAQGFFERFGFQVTIQQSPSIGNVVVPNAQMHKLLSIN